MDLARFPVNANELTLGLFIVELDRPWSESPFLIEGFMLEDEATLATLRQLCRMVYIDARRSSFNALPDMARKLLTAKPAEEKVVVRHVAGPPAAIVHAEKMPAEPDWLKKLKPQFAPKPTAAPTQGPKLVISAQEATMKDGPSITLDTQLMTPEEWKALKRDLADLLAHPAEDALKRVAAARDAVGASVANTLSKPLEGLKGLFRRKAPETPATRAGSNTSTGPTKILIYDDLSTTEGEFARALQAYERGVKAWNAAAQALNDDMTMDLADLEQAIGAMTASIVANPDGLAWISRTAASETGRRAQHALRVATAMMTHGRHLGWSRDEIERLGMGGLLLDIGLVLIPESIREKKSRLSLEEYEIVKTHVELVIDTIGRNVPLHTAVVDVIHQHHERLDGTGYPQGLGGNAISTYGRMGGIADAFSALTAPRAYARAVAPYDAILVLLKRSKQWFDPDLLETFVQAVGPYPVGTPVELSSGEIGLVMRSNRQHRLQPMVLVTTGPGRAPLAHPRKIDLQTVTTDAQGRPLKIARGLSIDADGVRVHEYHSALEYHEDSRA
jgi:HD-GYP domain-containing protein (c-di-GMP phosphodiesterase class II)